MDGLGEFGNRKDTNRAYYEVRSCIKRAIRRAERVSGCNQTVEKSNITARRDEDAGLFADLVLGILFVFTDVFDKRGICHVLEVHEKRHRLFIRAGVLNCDFRL
jgi:hypothetical protein